MSAPRLCIVAFVCLLAGSAAAQNQITVAKQDTLWSLSRTYGTTVEALMAANNLESDTIREGTVLNLPADAALPATAPESDAPLDQEADTETEAPTAAAAAAEPQAAAAVSYPDAEVYTVQPGDSLYSIARAYGFTLEEFMAINGLRSDVINPGQILKTRGDESGQFVTIVQPGDDLAKIAARHGISARQLAAANSITLHTVLNPGHRLTVPPADYVVAETVDSGPGDIGGAAGPTITVQPGDSLWNIARQHGTTVEDIMALNGLSSNNLRAGQSLRLVPGATPSATATGASTVDMIWPATGAITSLFGWRSLRIGGTNMHYGLDIDGDTGDPIYSATAGVVTFSGWRGGYGNLVIVEADGVEYYYAHASELLVSVGTIVAPGTTLARIGTTGNVTGSHLHFEIRVDGSPVDPLPVLEARAGSR